MRDLSERDKRILSLIQADFPLEDDPYRAVGEACGCSADEAYEAVQALCDEGYIRRLGAIFDSARLGYVSTLCALAVDNPGRVEQVAELVNAYPGVTHNYLRENRYNLWFTLTARTPDEISRTIDEIARRTGCPDILDLPAVRLFKIRVAFDLTGAGAAAAGDGAGAAGGVAAPASFASPREIAAHAPAFAAWQRALVRLLQGSVASMRHPFRQAALALSEQGFDCTSERLLEQARAWSADGTIRRFGAVVRHRQLGFTCNAMTVFDVPDADAERAGALLAADSRVSHAYERPRKPTWQANEYAMIHGKTREECFAAASDLHKRMRAAGISVDEPALLFSTREFKKRSMRYFCEEDAR